MGVSKPRTPSPGSGGNQLGILDLYQQCLAKQQNSMKQDLGELKLILAKQFLFGRPFFVSPPVVDESSAINKQIDLEIRMQLWEAGKYRGILEALRAQTKQEDRLFLLAWWLEPGEDLRARGHYWTQDAATNGEEVTGFSFHERFPPCRRGNGLDPIL
jgi:hypothetical protein